MEHPAQVLTASLDRLLVLADRLELSAVTVEYDSRDERPAPPKPEPAPEPVAERAPVAAHEPVAEREPVAESAPTVTDRRRAFTPALRERLEQLECELNELDGKLLGPRGKRRLADIRSEERNILDELGFESYLALLLATTDASF
jgi:pyruvate/2-oxoglutarate dehydrogenase complex dihydrolipoamide acyltransferase (E2) component